MLEGSLTGVPDGVVGFRPNAKPVSLTLPVLLCGVALPFVQLPCLIKSCLSKVPPYGCGTWSVMSGFLAGITFFGISGISNLIFLRFFEDEWVLITHILTETDPPR